MDLLNHVSKIYFTEFLVKNRPLLWFKLIKLNKKVYPYLYQSASRYRVRVKGQYQLLNEVIKQKPQSLTPFWEKGYFELLKYMNKRYYPKLLPLFLVYGVFTDRVDMIKYYFANDYSKFETPSEDFIYIKDINITYEYGDRSYNFKSPLARAVRFGNLAVIEYLLNEAKLENGQPYLNINDDNGPALATALKTNQLLILKYLIAKGANLNIYPGSFLGEVLNKEYYDVLEYYIRSMLKQNLQIPNRIVHSIYKYLPLEFIKDVTNNIVPSESNIIDLFKRSDLDLDIAQYVFNSYTGDKQQLINSLNEITENVDIIRSVVGTPDIE